MKKILALLILAMAASMLLGTAFALEPETIQMPLSEEKITIKMLASIDSGNANGVIENMKDIKFFPYMEELTNVHMDIVQAPNSDEAVTQFNLMIASGEIADVAIINSALISGGMASYIEDGVVVPLNDYLQYAPNLSALLEQNPEWRKAISTEDGLIYGFPKIKGEGMPRITHGFEIRQDWLDNVGLAIPTTIEEWDAVLEAFMTMDANGNGDATDEIPLGTLKYKKLGQNNNLVAMFANAYGLSDTFAQINGKVFFSPYEEDFFKVLTKLNEWYTKGYIDPDYLSLDEDAANAKIMSDRVGAFSQTLGSGMSKFLSVWNSEGLDHRLVGVPNLTAPDGVRYTAYGVSPVVSRMMLITSENDYIKETVQYFDHLFSEEGAITLSFGIEGESYTMVDGAPVFTDEILKNPNGLAASNALYRYCFGLADFPGYQLADAFVTAIVWPDQRAAGLMYNDGVTYMNLLNLQHTAEENNAINKNWGDIETYCIEMINKYIMGIEPLDTFPTFRENLKKMGIEEIIQYKQQAYDRSL